MDDVTKEAEKSEQAVDTESSTLEADIAAKMAKITGVAPDDAVTDETPSDEATVDEIVKETLDEIDKETETPDQTATEETEPDKKDTDVPMLPTGHRRAALAGGYTTEEIDHYLETKPEEAAARFGELFETWRDENSKWSARGRQLAAATKPDEKSDTKPKESPDVLPRYNAEELIKENVGSEDLINALVTPLNAVIDRVNSAVGRISKSEDFLRETEESALATVTQDFFASTEMKTFTGTYGTEVKELTQKQMDSRMELFAQADEIAAGAREHGRDISAVDALERAHVILSQGTRDETIRTQIRESMKARTKTTRSSHQSTKTPDTNETISDEELEKRTAERLQSLRNKV